jgi:predicted dehydrogenase
MNKKDKITVAIIGLGKRGRTHLTNFLKFPEISLIGVSDIKNVDSFGKSIKYYKDYLELLNKNNPKAVSICLPTALHYKVATECLKKGIHVLLEKPMTLTVGQAKNLISLSNKKKSLLMVGFNLKYDINIEKINKIIKSGKIGKIFMIRGRQSHDWGGLKPFSWLTNKAVSGGGTIIDNASHYLNLFEYLLGNISELQAFSNNLSFDKGIEDNAIISLKFKSKVLGIIETSWKDPSGRNNLITVYGSKGVIEYTDANDRKNLVVRYYNRDRDLWNIMNYSNYYIPKGIETLLKKPLKAPIITDNTNAMISRFISLIKNNNQRSEIKNTLLALRTVILVQASYESIKKSKVVKI